MRAMLVISMDDYMNRLRYYAIFIFSILLFSEFIQRVYSKKVILLDTSNSTTELRWKTHSNIDEDEIGWLEETYRGPEGLENRRAYVVCNVEHPSVDNWLRTPRIEREGANRMHVEITFTMRDCSEFPGNARSCKETFRLYATQVSNNQEMTDDWDESKWDLIDRIAADTGRHSKHESSPATVNQEVRSYTVTKDAVYFAFRDSGACISILNVKIFYELCPETTRSFVYFPQTITGPDAHSIIAVSGTCVTNASPTGVAGKLPTYVCKSTGTWDMPTGECKCNPGYIASVKYNTCTACAVGTYKAAAGEEECKVCPPHSSSSGTGSSECHCDAGYYRAEGESVHEGCTQPPSKPSRLSVAKVDQTSAVIEWDEPSSFGGRKELWYRYQCSTCPPTLRALPAEKTFTDRRLTLNGLHAGTTYTVMVFAENRVSKVASGLNQYGVIEFSTRPLTPMLVNDFRVEGVQENGVTIAWKAPEAGPSFKQSDIIYEIESKHNDTISVTETDNLYFTFDNLNPSFPYSFKVRAHTDLGWGPWSDALWYQTGRGQFLPTNSGVDNGFAANGGNGVIENHWTVAGPPLWAWVLLALVILLVVACVLFACSRRSKSNRKHFSDCDGLEPYKNGTLTPDYNTPPPQGFVQNLFRGKLGAPLISYGSHQSACYGNTRFKPYVDPTAYEDPNQALSEFANDVDPALIRITEVIGSGEFGEVCKGILQPNRRMGAFDMAQARTVAIKTLKPGSTEKAKGDFLMEASIMGQFDHENVIQLIGVVTKSEPVMIVTEYMENGSLDQFLRKHDDGLIGITQIIEILRGISSGMKYLTEKGYVHRDLAARNVLVDAELRCKIADFGLSRGLEGSVEQEYTTNGGKIPVRWTAPEAITHRKFTAASDVWSYGVVMWEVCSFGERPYWEWTNQKVISEITLGYRLPAPMDTPASLHSLMLRCWHIDRHKRPTFAQILQILEEYVRHPDLIYADSSSCCSTLNASTSMGPFSPSSASMSGMRCADMVAPLPPSSLPPPIPLDEMLTRIGLGHCYNKLHMAGIQSISDLVRLSHVDLLSYGLIAEEAQKIRDALNRQLATTQRSFSRPTDRMYHSSASSQPHMMTSLSQCRMASVPQAMSSVVSGNSDGFFV